MYIKIKNQETILRKAIKKSGSYRALAKNLSMPLSTISRYVKGAVMPKENFNSIMRFLDIKNKEDLINETFADNFRQIIAGKKCVLNKKKKGTFEKDMKHIRKFSSKKLKKWHKFMKKNKPKEYYSLQYSRFKKIGGYKYKTKKGERVRNAFEKRTADILTNLGIDYEYEPLVKVGNKYFFPDFLIKKRIIIECTAWRGETKAYQLKEKLNHLQREYQVFVVIPKALYRYYKILNKNLITGLDDFVPVAQTFLQKKKGSNR